MAEKIRQKNAKNPKNPRCFFAIFGQFSPAALDLVGASPHTPARVLMFSGCAARRGAIFLRLGLMVGRREPRGVGPCCCPPARAPPAGPMHSPLPTPPARTMLLTGAADSLWRGAEGLGARAVRLATREPAPPLHYHPTPIDGRRPSKSLRLYTAAAAAVPPGGWAAPH